MAILWATMTLLSLWVAVGDFLISWVAGDSSWGRWKTRHSIRRSVVAVLLWPVMVNNLRKQRQ